MFLCLQVISRGARRLVEPPLATVGLGELSGARLEQVLGHQLASWLLRMYCVAHGRCFDIHVVGCYSFPSTTRASFAAVGYRSTQNRKAACASALRIAARHDGPPNVMFSSALQACSCTAADPP